MSNSIKDKNPLFQQIQGLKANRVPLWYMRQAGRYLPKYQLLRKKYSFETLCKNKDLASEVTLLPIEYFKLDALILFSDILFVLEILKAKVHFNDHGPQISFSLEEERKHPDFNFNLKDRLYNDFDFVALTIKKVKAISPNMPLIGFCGGPLTLLSYLISDHFKNQFKTLRSFLYNEEKLAHQILEKISALLIEYLSLQIDAGVNLIQIFDTWGFQFPYEHKQIYSMHYLNKIVSALKNKYKHKNIPIFLFGKQYGFDKKDFELLKFDGFSFDSSHNLIKLSSEIPEDKWIQGNLDPFILFSEKKIIKKALDHLIPKMKKRNRYIFNLGHGVLPNTPVDNVQYLTEWVHELGKI